MRAAWQTGGMGGTSRRTDPASHVHMRVAERRHYRRGHLAMNVKLIVENETLDAVLIDFSAGGAQLRSSLVPRIGIEIGIEMQELGCFNATVVRRLSTGIAVEFNLMDQQGAKFAAALQALLVRADF